MTEHSAAIDHEAYMLRAIELAQQNPQAPFGCVLVDRPGSKVVAMGINQSSAIPTLHGEIAAINDYAKRGGTDWDQLTLYTTAEPCCMCQGAILWSGIREVVYGTSIKQLIALGWRQIDLPAKEVVARSWNPNVVVIAGICADQCDQMFAAAKS